MQQLLELAGVRQHDRQRVVRDHRLALGQALPEIGEHAGKNRLAVYRLAHHALVPRPRKFEQVIDQPPHANHAAHDEAQELASVRVELVLIAPLEQIGEVDDRAQRLLQVMGRDIREFFEFRIDAREFRGALSDAQFQVVVRLLQGLLGPLEGRDITQDGRHADDVATIVLDRRAAQRNVDRAAILPDAHRLIIGHLLAGSQQPAVFVDFVPALTRHHGDIATDDFVHGIAQ